MKHSLLACADLLIADLPLVMRSIDQQEHGFAGILMALRMLLGLTVWRCQPMGRAKINRPLSGQAMALENIVKFRLIAGLKENIVLR